MMSSEYEPSTPMLKKRWGGNLVHVNELRFLFEITKRIEPLADVLAEALTESLTCDHFRSKSYSLLAVRLLQVEV